ncbi:helix-turn-helix domain-containing protein [Paenibacillus rhizoplanae]
MRESEPLFHFCKTFKKLTGRTFIDYVNFCRMDEAQRLLLETDLTITEISGRVGCDNPNYFTKLYKQYKGLTPSQARKTGVNPSVCSGRPSGLRGAHSPIMVGFSDYIWPRTPLTSNCGRFSDYIWPARHSQSNCGRFSDYIWPAYRSRSNCDRFFSHTSG